MERCEEVGIVAVAVAVAVAVTVAVTVFNPETKIENAALDKTHSADQPCFTCCNNVFY